MGGEKDASFVGSSGLYDVTNFRKEEGTSCGNEVARTQAWQTDVRKTREDTSFDRRVRRLHVCSVTSLPPEDRSIAVVTI